MYEQLGLTLLLSLRSQHNRGLRCYQHVNQTQLKGRISLA